MRNVHPNHPQQKLIKNKLNYLSTNLTDNNILNLVRYKFLLILWGERLYLKAITQNNIVSINLWLFRPFIEYIIRNTEYECTYKMYTYNNILNRK